MQKRLILQLKGIVQGVGLRPTLYQWIKHFGFHGTLQNRGDGVLLILEGEEEKLSTFSQQLEEYLPPKASLQEKIESWEISQQLSSFTILESEVGAHQEISIPVDLATCPECFKEFHNPENRRYHYPFIACTQCGPRYTVVEGVPYDRKQTTLKMFPLCEACLSEYQNVSDRRFRAESIACARCGPRLRLEIKSETGPIFIEEPEKIYQALEQFLKQGEVLAVRGLGGYLFVCDARNRETLQKLRTRKKRPYKAFAIMARNLETLKQECLLSPEEEEWLTSDVAPIVILEPHPKSTLPLDLLTPDGGTLGVMLPTTPIHQILFGIQPQQIPFDFLVMTSGNAYGEPICRTNEEAYERLSPIVDIFLTHNREIARTCDDSLCRKNQGVQQVWRRARGFTPEKFLTTQRFPFPVLGLGGELKNTLCLGYDKTLVLSPHIGDLIHFETFCAFQKWVEDFPKFLGHPPQALVVDLHPDYHSTQMGKKLAEEKKLLLLQIQHHEAHAIACLFENQLNEAICFVFDGTGYGEDRTIWGGEMFSITPDTCQRMATFAPSPLAGGDKAILEPARQAFARLPELQKEKSFFEKIGISSQEANLFRQMIDRKVNTSNSRSIGRLFDSVSALIGVAPKIISYEAQAAIRLETLAKQADTSNTQVYSYQIEKKDALSEVQTHEMFLQIWNEFNAGEAPSQIAWKFHQTLASIILDLAILAQKETNQNQIALTGGVFQNQILTQLAFEKLTQKGFHVFISQKIPPNDGGISLGQVLMALRELQNYA